MGDAFKRAGGTDKARSNTHGTTTKASSRDLSVGLDHVAHGASNAALLGVVMEFSLTGNPSRYAHVARALGENISGLTDFEAAQRGAEAVKRLIKDVKIASLRELGVDREKLYKLAPRMTEDAIASGSPANNPRQATREEIIELYKLAYEQ